MGAVSRTAAERAAQAERLRARPARGRILAAARELAAQGGYENIKVGELAAAAKVSRETFYTHFADKRACFAEAVDSRLGEIDAWCRSAFEDGEPWAEPIVAALEEALAERFDCDASPRGRIIAAMLEQVGKRGYEATRLGDVIRAAHSSYPVFYRHFEGKRECFAAACESLLRQIDLRAGATLVLRAAGEEAGPKLVAIAEILAEDPTRARILLIEAGGLGGEIGQEAASPRTLDALIRAAVADLSAATGLPASMHAGAVIEILRRALLRDQLGKAPTQVAELVEDFRPGRSSRTRSPRARRGPGARRGRRLATIG